MTQLSELLEKTSRKSLLEADKDEAEFVQEKLQKVPLPNLHRIKKWLVVFYHKKMLT